MQQALKLKALHEHLFCIYCLTLKNQDNYEKVYLYSMSVGL